MLGPLLLVAADSPEVRWWKHVSYLASDSLEGREAAGKGYLKAVRYVSNEFKKASLEPCFDNRYLQPVPLVQRTLSEERSYIRLSSGPLELGKTAIFTLRLTGPSPQPVDNAGAVFVGYGLAVPDAGYDDYTGLDLRGKVAVYVSGSPASLPSVVRAHASSSAERAAAMRAAGAVGSIALTNPAAADVAWDRSVLSRLAPSMLIGGSGAAGLQGLHFSVSLNPAESEIVFEGTGQSFKQMLALMDKGERLPRFALPFRVSALASVQESEVSSPNVCGMIRGSGDEAVVLSAHLDHIGVGGAINGDRIYNGAMDNASGIATMIEVARAITARRVEPRRSILFAAVTAEEKGLLGSRYFAANPPVPASQIAANINFDMYLPIHPLRHLMVLGLEESTLRAPLERVAAKHGIALQPDSEPQRNRFIRSDQYSFILKGVPAFAVKFGYTKGSPEEKLQREWTSKRYHAPGDDLAQPVDKGAAVLFNRIIEEFALEVAESPVRPAWNESSFFRRFAR